MKRQALVCQTNSLARTLGRTLAADRAAGATAILAATLAPDAGVVRSGPSIGVGIGGWGGSGRGTVIGGVGFF
jgi:hypothetical protein